MTAGDWRAALDRLDGTVRRLHDTRPAWPVCTVLAVGRYSPSGASFVTVDWFGQAREASYLDGPAPVVGDRLMVAPRDNTAHAPLVALPLPLTAPTTVCALGHFWAAAKNADNGQWDVIYCDLSLRPNGYPTWLRRSRHPAGDSWERYPLYNTGDGSALDGGVDPASLRLFTFGTDASLAACSSLYRSDDRGATWVSCGVAVVEMTKTNNYGQMIAVGPAGVYRSTDNGTSWSWVFGPPPDGSRWLAVGDGGTTAITAANDLGPATFDPFVAGTSLPADLRWNGLVPLVSSSGVWTSVNMFAHYYLPTRVPNLLPGPPHNYAWSDSGDDPSIGSPRPDAYGAFLPAPADAVCGIAYSTGSLPWTYLPGDATYVRAIDYDQDGVAPGTTLGGFGLTGGVVGPTFVVEDGGLANGAVVYRNFVDDYGGLVVDYYYLAPTDHPLARATAVADAQAAYPSTGARLCYVVGLLEATPGAGAPPFLAANLSGAGLLAGDPNRPIYEDVSQNQPADLGAYYTPSIQGITTEQANFTWLAENPYV